jgi:hypothetical protein
MEKDGAQKVKPEDLRFKIDGEYTVEEFTFRLATLAELNPELKGEQFIADNLKWCKGFPAGTMIRFRVGEDGVVHPYRLLGSAVLPTEPEEDNCRLQ